MQIEYGINSQTGVANFIVFPVETTNIFPLANSKAGGQLLSEYNLRCRDTVTTRSNIQYHVGPSFVHGKSDFHVKSGSDIATSSTVLEITPGTAVVNGHYIESFTDIFIDIAELNSERIAEGNEPLTGKLAVGLKAFYSTEATMSGAMLVEKQDAKTGVEMYMGIQVIIGKQDYMKTPEESGSSIGDMTCHLKLATFSFYNGAIRNLVNVHEKFEWLEAERIANVEEELGQYFTTKSKLDPHKLYVYSTKSLKDGSKDDTWCDATHSEFIWDKTPTTTYEQANVSDESAFGYNKESGKTFLRLAHMQVDGMKDSAGSPMYYQDHVVELPRADYGLNTGGTVDKTYTQNIKRLSRKVDQYHQLVGGKQVYYLTTRTSEFSDMPSINSNWNVGDYCLVANDYTLQSTDGTRPPSSLYAVLPGYVTRYSYYAAGEVDSDAVPEGLTGVELESVTTTSKPIKDELPSESSLAAFMLLNTPISPGSEINITYTEPVVPGSGEDPEEYTYTITEQSGIVDYETGVIDVDRITDNTLRTAIENLGLDNWKVEYKYVGYDLTDLLTDYTSYRGTPQVDYFTIIYTYTDENDSTISHFQKFYFTVYSASPREWSEGILLTGEFGLATDTTVGGFINVDDSYQDAGYVIMNDEGHLQLMDYSLLRSGVLAYQLGENITLPTGIDSEEVQTYLDDYINQRVAFPNINQIANATDPNVIDVYLDLVAEEEATTINIYDIDSRFGTSVYLHITGSADNNTTINILDCEKLRIDNSVVTQATDTEDGAGTGPIINVYRCGLYYDAEVFNYIFENRNDTDADNGFTGMQDIKLWYQRYSDSDSKIFVDGMTVRREADTDSSPDLTGKGDVVTWGEYDDDTKKNDYHYSVWLHSLTFSGTGEVVGLGILIQNSTTANVEGEYKSIVYKDMQFPNDSELPYPARCITCPVKVTGEFITSYHETGDNWVVQDSKFSLHMKGYDSSDEATTIRATIAILEQSTIIPYDLTAEMAGISMDPWSSTNPHVFYGSTLK